jgi:hypothetical protein
MNYLNYLRKMHSLSSRAAAMGQQAKVKLHGVYCAMAGQKLDLTQFESTGWGQGRYVTHGDHDWDPGGHKVGYVRPQVGFSIVGS